MPDIPLTSEELAASCYRAWSAACAFPGLAWEQLSLDDQTPWLKVARKGEEILSRMQGKTYHAAGLELHGLAGDCTFHSPLAWEAVARHLTTLLDADDIDDLGGLEQSWRDWAAKKQPQPQGAIHV